MISLPRRLAAEALGTAFLLTAVVGSGIMAQHLALGNDALALLCNTVATGAALVVIITVFAPLSGAHFNPAVTLYFAMRGEIGARDAALYAVVQVFAAIAGVWIAHAMFALPIVEVSHKLRDGPSQWLSEFVATFGLLLTIAGCARKPDTTPALVGLYIAAAYWFTASTSFANPAVTVARAMTDSFAGIAPRSAPGFVVAQVFAVAAALLVAAVLFRPSCQPPAKVDASRMN
jgi:glycerol uptake facilitator-like aquaporin